MPLWVGQYSKNINFKMLVIKLLYGCNRDMFKVNGFILLSVLLVYSLKMVVTGQCNRNIIKLLVILFEMKSEHLALIQTMIAQMLSIL